MEMVLVSNNAIYAEMNLPNGGRRDIFMTHAVAISTFIKANKIKPVQMEVLQSRIPASAIATKEIKSSKKVAPSAKAAAPVAMTAMAMSTAESAAMIPWLINGGMKVPHLHYKGEIYLLSDKQWADFSAQVLGEFRQKLASVKSVGFNQLLDLSDAMNDIQ